MLHRVTWLVPHLPGALVLVPAPHSLRTAPRRPLVPMSQIACLSVCRAEEWLAIGFHTIQWTV